MTIAGEEPIVVVDTKGCPSIMAGSLPAGYRVMEIWQIAADGMVFLKKSVNDDLMA